MTLRQRCNEILRMIDELLGPDLRSDVRPAPVVVRGALVRTNEERRVR